MKKVQIVPLSRKAEMRKLYNNYLTELASFNYDISFDKLGEPIDKWFDFYWIERQRFPFYLIIDGKPAGLCLVRELDDSAYEIAEFYILPEHRRDGNALWFALEISNLFEGNIEFSAKHTNPRAMRFWDKFISCFSSSSSADNDGWRIWKIDTNTKKK